MSRGAGIDCTSAESPGSALGQRTNLERPGPTSGLYGHGWWRVGMVSLIFLDQFMQSFQGRLSQRAEKPSKAQKLVSYQDTCPPRMHPSLWKTNLTTLPCLLALCQKGPLLIQGHGASVDFLSETVPSQAGGRSLL